MAAWGAIVQRRGKIRPVPPLMQINVILISRSRPRRAPSTGLDVSWPPVESFLAQYKDGLGLVYIKAGGSRTPLAFHLTAVMQYDDIPYPILGLMQLVELFATGLDLHGGLTYTFMACQQIVDACAAVGIHVQELESSVKTSWRTIAVDHRAPGIDSSRTVRNGNRDGIVAADIEWTMTEET